MLKLPQLSIREFWEEVEHPELGTRITYPGAFAKLAEGSCGIRRRAPHIGEHNEEIYIKEMGMSPEELAHLAQTGSI